ncbi:hypothetical protein MKZ38_002855 [Zalerion maritima]|uniref:Uncharacterized protein n=1 Tax=Zalerion maritima TaxID=339359 RepID=A0AAD5RZ29_9PEZI|nr:hypothetical protein MKZ38_002855 [Zalerion maritima]
MAQPALLQVNGMPGLAHRPDSPMAVPSKRKREASVDAPADAPVDDNQQKSKDATDSTSKLSSSPSSPPPRPSQSQKEEIDNFFHALQPLDDLSILQRTIPSGDQKSSTAEPYPKRQKSEDPRPSTTIAGKVSSAGYESLDLFIKDVLAAIKEYKAEIISLPSQDKIKATAKASLFKEKVVGLHRHEIYYPDGGPVKDTVQSTANGGTNVLTAWGNTGQPKQLFSSLQRTGDDGQLDILQSNDLPDAVSLTKVMPAPSNAPQTRAPTLGEIFPAPRNIPPLQPPKAPKNVTRDKELGFYHPELSKRSPSRASVYSFSHVSTGHFLDYSNATPPSRAGAKQRERAQSLAGVKPSTLELEMSEMEALFRGSFSSFAPTRDDSKAIIPSSTLGRMWWQSAGYRQFQRVADTMKDEEATEEAPILPEVDMEYLEGAIQGFDEMAIDPSLEKAIAPAKSKEEMDTDDLLQEVSDLIQALDSYQRNRNLTMPTTQNRHGATDPANGDMLKNASAVQPSEDEVMTYEMLKTQLSLIVGMLPPHAVAKLQGLPDGDLLVSKRLEIRSDSYNGIMDEDESSIRAKQQQQQQAAAPQPAAVNMPRTTPHRTPSVSGPAPGAYGTPTGFPASQYTQQSRPMPNQQQYYGQTPVRQPVNMPPRPTPGIQQQISQPQRAPPVGQPYPPRPGGYPNYSNPMYKQQTPYGTGGTPQYGAGTPPQRMAQPPQHAAQHTPHAGYGQVPTAASPSARYSQPSQYAPAYPQQQQQQHQQQPIPQQQPQQQQSYHGYPNGTPMGQRPMPQQMPSHHQYGGSPGQQHAQHRPPPPGGYGSPAPQPQMHPGMQRQYPTQSPHPMNQQNPPQHLRSGYHTVMNEHQHHSIVERAQAQARQTAHEKTLGMAGSMPAHGAAGLAGIGLGGGMGNHRGVSAARVSMPTNSTPSPRMNHGQPMVQGNQPPVNGNPYHGQPMYSQQHMPNPHPTPSPVHMQSPHAPPHAVPSPQPRPAQ